MSAQAILSVILWDGQTAEERAASLTEMKARFEKDNESKQLGLAWQGLVNKTKENWSNRDGRTRQDFMLWFAENAHLPANYIDALFHEAGIPDEEENQNEHPH